MATPASTTKVLNDLNKKFIDDLDASLIKMHKRHERVCDYDGVVEGCKRNNPDHFKTISHPHNYKKGDINEFKTDTDKFITNSYNIYKANNNNQFSSEWVSKISERTGNADETGYTLDQFAQSIFNDYSTFYFLFLANVILNIDYYISKTDYDFLISLFQHLESADATGLYDIKQNTEIGNIMNEWAKDERNNIDYRLGNTTIQNILKNKRSKRTIGTIGRTGRRFAPYGGSKKYRSKSKSKSKSKRKTKKIKKNSKKSRRI